MYYIYILSCQDGSLYTGITPDLKRRMRQHWGLCRGGAKYTRSHPPQALCGLWETDDHTAAAQFEIYCKQLSRQKKQALLASPDNWAVFFPQLDTQRYTPCTPEPLSYYLGT